MALSELLSPTGRAALAEVIEYRGGTPGEVLEQAVLEHRDAVLRPRPCAVLRLYLCDQTVASASTGLAGRPGLSIAGPCLAVELVARCGADRGGGGCGRANLRRSRGGAGIVPPSVCAMTVTNQRR